MFFRTKNKFFTLNIKFLKLYKIQKHIFLLFLFFFIYLLLPQSLFSSVNFSDYRDYKKTLANFNITKVTKGINSGWGMTFFDNNLLLVTEKSGRILLINTTSGEKKEINYTINSKKTKKNPFANGQGGLLDILYHDDYIYISFSYTENNQKNFRGNLSGSTAIARGKLLNQQMIDFKIIMVSQPSLKVNKHWGCRMVIKGNYLFASIGERGYGMIAQDPTKHPGSIIRIKLNGEIPTDNPKYQENPNWLPEIYQIGLRNPQGMTISPHDGEIYFSQHGPRGGDNIGKVKFAGNFGWKEIAWGGSEYYGGKIGEVPFKDKYGKPIIAWVPSIAIGQIGFYKGQTFKEWEGDLIGTATKTGLLFRLDFEKNKIVDKEIIIKQKLGRIRDFEVDVKGDIFIIVDDYDGFLWKLSRK